jgi:hypothetical protein
MLQQPTFGIPTHVIDQREVIELLGRDKPRSRTLDDIHQKWFQQNTPHSSDEMETVLNQLADTATRLFTIANVESLQYDQSPRPSTVHWEDHDTLREALNKHFTPRPNRVMETFPPGPRL